MASAPGQVASGSMYGRALLMVLAASACSHGESARAAAVECRALAKSKVIAGLNAEEACALVRERASALLAADGAALTASLTIELDLSRAGSAIAHVRESRGGVAYAYPEIAVDVMDRSLRREDLVRLADTIAAAVSAGPQSN